MSSTTTKKTQANTGYLVFAPLTLLVNFIFFLILSLVNMNMVTASFIAWLLAMVFAYTTHKIYILNNKNFNNSFAEFGSFAYHRILTIVFDILLLIIANKFIGLNLYLSKFIVSTLMLVACFFINKLNLFPKNEDTDSDEKKTLWQKLALIDNAENSTSNVLSGNITYIISFVLPLIILIIIYKGRQIFPFGEECYLRSDMYHQYAPFFSELWYKLTNGESLTYSFNIGLGTNFTALSAYYLASPTNWFVFLFPQKYTIEIMNVLIILKMAGSCTSFTYYINKHYNTKSILSACFGIFYGISGYLAAYSWNIMWLDCILLLPLIILGLEKLVKEDKYMLYTISLGLCIFSNYYIAIMVCLGMILLFIYNMISLPKQEHFYLYLKKILNFGIFSLLAGGLAAILLIPEIYAFKLSASNDFNFPELLETYFPILEMLTRHLPMVEVHLGLEHLPNIYCGSFIFLLLPLYMINPKINLRDRVAKLVIIFVLLTSFNMNIPNFVWHGFHFPNSLPARQGFIYIFVVLTACFEASYYIREYTKNQIMKAYGIAIAFLIVAEYCYSGDLYLFKSFYMAGIFITLYLCIILIHNYSKVTKYITLVLLIVIPALECGRNLEATGLSTTNRTGYLENYDSVEDIKKYLAQNDDSFYRTEFLYGYRSKNDTAWHNLKGVSTFSSTANAGMTDLLDALGCECSFNAYSAHGMTAVTSALLNVKYTISPFYRTEGHDLSFEYNAGNYYLYENNYTLSPMFLVDPNLNERWDFSSQNPFDIQNQFMYINTGVNNIFYELPIQDNNGSKGISLEYKQHVYLFFPNNTDGSMEVIINGTSRHYYLNNVEIIDLGYLHQNDTVYFSNPPFNMKVFGYNEGTFMQGFEKLAENSLNVTSFDDTHINGTLNASYAGTVMCSIPYDQGWTVYVDGKKVETKAMKDALLSFDVDAGEHTIELSYYPAGLGIGIAITSVSLIALITIFIYDTMKKNSRKNKKEER